MNTIADRIQNRISELYNSKKATWLENYVKHNIKSYGVGIPVIRNIIIEETENYWQTEKDFSFHKDFLNQLMKSEYTEDKIAAILFLQIHENKFTSEFILDLIDDWFNKKLIFDWNVCDWLCVRVLSNLVNRKEENVLNTLSEWNKDKYLWKARASLVAFAYADNLKQYKNFIYNFSIELIQREERFSKTAVGWLLREYSKIDLDFVTQFIEKNISYFTKETINNALKYIDKSERSKYLNSV